MVNKLSLNLDKTKAMQFCNNRSKVKNEQLNITVANHNIDQVHHFKYLGMTLDCHLTFENHINAMCNKISSKTGILSRIRSFIPLSLARDAVVLLQFSFEHFNIFAVLDCFRQQIPILDSTEEKVIFTVFQGIYRFPYFNLHI